MSVGLTNGVPTRCVGLSPYTLHQGQVFDLFPFLTSQVFDSPLPSALAPLRVADFAVTEGDPIDRLTAWYACLRYCVPRG